MFNNLRGLFFIFLNMIFFDFHHHNSENTNGIYNLKFGENIPDSLFSAGIHPNSIDENTEEQFSWLHEISMHQNCAAIGECGLDGLINVDEKLQEKIFEQQILLANKLRKPLIIHCVKRFSQLIHFQKKATLPMIVHGFNKRETVGNDLLNHDFYLSFGKSLLQNVNLQEFVRNFPVEKLFLETDSADFDLKKLYEKLAELKNLSVETVSEHINNNLKTLQILK